MKVEKLSFFKRLAIATFFILITYGLMGYIEQIGQ